MRSPKTPRRPSGAISAGQTLAFLTLFFLLSTSWLFGSCAHSNNNEQELIGEPVSQQTRQQIEAGRNQMIGAMASFIREVDRDVCQGEKGRRASLHRQQAFSEAYLEVMRAIERSEAAATPDDERQSDREIVWMDLETPGPDAVPQVRWECRNASDHQQCVNSTATSVARLLYRSKFEGYSLEPDRMADLLQAAGADLRWALDVTRRTTDTSPGAAIAEKCRAGESPLRSYLADAEGRSIRAIEDGFVGDHEDFCPGLAATYLDVVESLRAHFEQSLIGQRCSVREWSPIDE